MEVLLVPGEASVLSREQCYTLFYLYLLVTWPHYLACGMLSNSARIQGSTSLSEVQILFVLPELGVRVRSDLSNL